MSENEHVQTPFDSRTDDEWMLWAELFELAAMGLLPTTEQFAAVLVNGDYRAATQEIAAALGIDVPEGLQLLDIYEGANADATFHELRRERTRLFIGERKPLITPYAGVRYAQARGQQGQLMVGEESMAIERFMRRCGVEKDLAAGQSNDPVDHIGTLCEFMQYLCLVAARAVLPSPGASATVADAIAFQAEHFAPYATWCAERLREEARAPYYQFLPSLLTCLAAW